MDMEMRQGERMEMAQGDFCESCLPKTYRLFKQIKADRQYRSEKMDCFDCFIKDRVPLFSFLTDQYYERGKCSELQLRKLADDKILPHLDEHVARFVQTEDAADYEQVKILYIWMLEAHILKLTSGETL